MNLAVIPARGGSKRIPRKNVREFCGRPMIAHPIEVALRSGLFDHVIVSTDDPEIADVARSHGASVPFVRPAELSDDHAATTPVVAHAVQWALDEGLPLDACCCLYATAPFVRSADLHLGFTLLQSGGWKYVFSATTFAFPVLRAIRQDDSGRVSMLFPEHFSTRSQDLPEALHDAGQFYWGRPQAWLAGDRIFDVHSTTVLLPRWRVQDIDTPEDWGRAELLWRVIEEDERREEEP